MEKNESMNIEGRRRFSSFAPTDVRVVGYNFDKPLLGIS